MPFALPLPLRTERLVLRPWTDDDLAPYAALNADPRVMEHFPSTMTRPESDASAGRIRAALDANGIGFLAVDVPAEDVRFAGFVGLHRPAWASPFRSLTSPPVEIGWRLSRATWGRGIAREAALACLEAAFGELAVSEVVAFTVPRNVRSRRVMEAIGMIHDEAGDFDHPSLAEGHPLRRHVLYRADRTAWLSRVEANVRSGA